MTIILLDTKYKSIKQAARLHNLNYQTLAMRIKIHGENWSHLFDKRIDHSVVIQNTKYKSISEAARKNNVSPSALINRILRNGINDPNLFKPVKSSNTQIKINNVIYKSIAEAARKNNISKSVLYNRIKRYGNNNDLLFKPVIGYKSHPRAKSIILNGKTYENIKSAAKIHHMPENRLRYRITRYGKNDNRLFAPPIIQQKPIILNGKAYVSLQQAARENHTEFHKLKRRIKLFGTTSDKLFANINLTNNQQIMQKSLQKKRIEIAELAHHKNALTQYEVYQKTNIPVKSLHSTIQGLISNTHQTSLGIQRNDIIKIKYGYQNLYILKKQVLLHIYRKQIKLPNLVDIPQCDNRYFYDPTNNQVYSHINAGIGFKKMKYITYTHRTWRFRLKHHSYLFNEPMIKDLIQNPLIVANNLISKEQICTSLNIENLDSKLSQKLTAHTRCNFKSNIKVTGYTKKQVNFIKQYYME